MENCLVTLKSVTYSMKAQMLLSQNAIPVTTIKLDSNYTSKGCTHGIRFDCRYRRTVERLLRENGVPYSDIKSS